MFQKPFVAKYLQTLLNTPIMLRKHDIPIYVICIQYLCNKVHDTILAEKYLIKGLEYYKNNKLLCVQNIYIELSKYNLSSDISSYTKCKTIIQTFKNDLKFHLILFDILVFKFNTNKVAKRLLHIIMRYVFNIYFMNK